MGSNPGGGNISRTRPVHTSPEAHTGSCTRSRYGSLPGVKRKDRGVDHLPHLPTRFKKEYIYTTRPICRHSRLRVNSTFTFTFTQWCRLAAGGTKHSGKLPKNHNFKQIRLVYCFFFFVFGRTFLNLLRAEVFFT